MDAPFGTVILKDLMVPMRDGARLSTDVYLPARDGRIADGRFPTLLGRTSYDKEAEHLRDWVMRMPLKRGASPLALIPSLEKVFFDYYEGGDDSDYWRQDCINFEAHLDRFADVPTVIRCGWYDIFALSNAPIFSRLQRERRGPVRLIYGPWVHNACERTYAGDVEFGPEAALDHNALRLRWFDRWLKGIENPSGAGYTLAGGGGLEDEPPVRIFVMGGGDGRKDPAGRMRHGGRWREEREWPLARTAWTPFYLCADGGLRPTPPRPSGTAHPHGALTFAFDPSHPVPTISGNVASYYEHLPVPEGIHPSMSPPRARMRSIVQMGASDQVERPDVLGCRPPYGPLAARPDVLVFQTPPLERDLEVTGPLVARLWVSSDAPDTDFTAKLVDVHPPNEDYPRGYAMSLADGIRRARYRSGYARGEPMEAGQVYELTIELGPTSNLFAAGHRIRVDVSSSNFPRFDVNPNTGQPLGRHTNARVARNSVYVDAARPSHILLPVIP